ncbi:MAG: hypothetical protein C0518_13145 [Opitutus sp.]|nr:hypothetical protein [Opitutus sp.]
MDESFQDIENELKALRPRRPSVLLRARVEHDLATETAAAARADSSLAPTAATTPVLRETAPARRYTTATTLRSWKWVSWQMAAAAAVALIVSLGVWHFQRSSGGRTALPSAHELAATPQTNSPSIVPETAVAPRVAPRAVQPSDSGERLLASTTPRDAYRPVKAANVLYDLQDEGPVLLEDNTPARRVRARYVDTYTWKNPATNASLKWSVPRDEVRVLPARFH